MNEQQGQQRAVENDAVDIANNEVGPTEKLREDNKSETKPSVPGAQNPESEEIKEEQGPNTE